MQVCNTSTVIVTSSNSRCTSRNSTSWASWKKKQLSSLHAFFLPYCLAGVTFSLGYWEFSAAGDTPRSAHSAWHSSNIHPSPSDLPLLTTCLVGIKVCLLLSNAGVSCSISKLRSSLVAQFQNCVCNFEIGTQFGNWQNSQCNFEIAQIAKTAEHNYIYNNYIYIYIFVLHCVGVSKAPIRVYISYTRDWVVRRQLSHAPEQLEGS